jgi:N-acetylglucosamine-6-phosphate deacetylase
VSDGRSEFLVVDAGTVLTPYERFSPGRIVLRNDRIEGVGLAKDLLVPDGARGLEAPHWVATPGFIDPHIHGCGGFDVMDATPASLNAISRILSGHGTTSFLPTTVSTTIQGLDSFLHRMSRSLGNPFDGAKPLGLHLEGPFINPNKRGAHSASHVRLPDKAALARWIQMSNGTLKLLTLAPELPGASEVADLARTADIVVGMGHSDASFAEASLAADAGIRYAVHTFNAMRAFSHRDSGMVGAVLADDRIFAEIIADGVHVNPEVVRIFARSKGFRRVILVTDAISATGMPDGQYSLGDRAIHVTHGTCRDEEGRLAGSTLTQDAALRNFVQWTGATLQDALMGLTVNPAEALNLEGRGRIEPGAHADLTMFDNDLRVRKTIVGGRVVFDSPA